MTTETQPNFQANRCMPRPPETLGVVHCEADRCAAGLTLCWSFGDRSARLIDLDGAERHRWSVDFGPRWHETQLLDNGHLLVVACEKPYNPKQVSEHRLLELAPDSSVVWQSHARVHHDAHRLPNGHTLVAANAPAHYPELRDAPLIYDYLQELDPAGAAVWNWHFARHQAELELPPQVEIPDMYGDWPHINTVESLPPNAAGEKDPRFRAGNVLVSPRHLHLIFIIDRDTDEIVWQWGRGELLGQHQPTILPNGNILLYDNGRGPGPRPAPAPRLVPRRRARPPLRRDRLAVPHRTRDRLLVPRRLGRAA